MKSQFKAFLAFLALTVLLVANQNCSKPKGFSSTNNRQTDNNQNGDEPTQLSSLEGKTIAFVNRETRSGQNQHHIFLMDLDKDGLGVNLRALTPPSSIEPEDQPIWSPDGTKIAYHNGAGMWFINADGTGKTLIGSTDSLCGSNPDWSPDGKKFVYAKVISSGPGCTPPASGVPNTEIRSINADGSGDQLILSSGGTFNVEPRWTVDNKIVFMSGRAGSQDAFMVNLDGTGLTQLTFSSSPGVGVVGDPFVSPNGQFISFNSNREGAPLLNVFTMDIQSKVIQQLTFYKQENGHVYEAGDTSWTSDGDWITFEYDIDGQGQSDDSVYADVRIVPADVSAEPIATGQICSGVGCAPRWKP